MELKSNFKAVHRTRVKYICVFLDRQRSDKGSLYTYLFITFLIKRKGKYTFTLNK